MHCRVMVVSTYHLTAQYDPIAFIGQSTSQGSGPLLPDNVQILRHFQSKMYDWRYCPDRTHVRFDYTYDYLRGEIKNG